MIYVEEKNIDRQFDLLRHLSRLRELELVAWIYPESNIVDFLDHTLYDSAEITAEPVTTYQEGVVARCTERICLTENLLIMLKENKQLLINSCDSLCLYQRNEFKWLACTVGHEGMGLVRDDSLLTELRSIGFNASAEPPSWW